MDQLPLMLAEVAQPLRFPAEPVLRSAEIEGGYRFSARRAWGAGPCILWNLLNPSKADHKVDDPTMRRMMGFSFRWGFGSMIVTNVYPFISSRPQEMLAWRRTWEPARSKAAGFNWDFDKSSYTAWVRNQQVVSAAFEEATTYVAAWGNGAIREDLESFLDGAQQKVDTSEHDGLGVVDVPVEWKCLGTTRDGSPIHPLARGKHRVPDDKQLEVWRKAA